MLLGTLILLGIFLLYDSSTEFIDENFVPEFLPTLFNKSLFLYCLSSIFVFTIFGFNFSVLGMSSALILRNKYLGMAFPIVYYHCAPIIVWIIGNSFPFLFYIFPVDVLNIVSHDINYLVTVYFLIFIAGTGLTYKAYKKCINGEW